MKSRIATPPAATPKHGVTGERDTRPVEEHDQTIALRPLFQSVTGVVFCARFDRVSRGRHFHPLGWDHACGPKTRARVLLTLGALEKMLDGVDHGGGPDLAERIVTDRPAPESAFIQIDVEQLRDPSLRPTRARSCHKQRTVHGVVLRKCCLMMETRPESVEQSHPHP